MEQGIAVAGRHGRFVITTILGLSLVVIHAVIHVV